MGNLFYLSKIKENLFSCLGPKVLDSLWESTLYNYISGTLRTPNEYSSTQSESVSLLIGEDDVPPGIIYLISQ